MHWHIKIIDVQNDTHRIQVFFVLETFPLFIGFDTFLLKRREK